VVSFKRNSTSEPGGDLQWIPLPEGLWTFEVSAALIVPAKQVGWNDQVRFKLMLTDAEKTRLEEERSEPLEPGLQAQSWQTTYSAGATLNGNRRTGYTPTKLTEFLIQLFGKHNVGLVSEWIQQGGGPNGEENEDIEQWLGWFVGLEVQALIGHSPPAQDGTVWSRVKAVMARADKEYSQFGRRKLREMIQQLGQVDLCPRLFETPAPPPPAAPEPKKRPGAVMAPHSSDAAATAVAEPVADTGQAFDDLFPDDDAGDVF
jgi:hypothetical protein